MAQDGKHIPSKKFKDNFDGIFRKKKKGKKIGGSKGKKSKKGFFSKIFGSK